MAFDIIGARQAGYTDGDIINALAGKMGFDVNGAQKAGFDDNAILSTLLSKEGVGTDKQAPAEVRPPITDDQRQQAADLAETGFGDQSGTQQDVLGFQQYDPSNEQAREQIKPIASAVQHPIGAATSLAMGMGEGLTMGRSTEQTDQATADMPSLGLTPSTLTRNIGRFIGTIPVWEAVAASVGSAFGLAAAGRVGQIATQAATGAIVGATNAGNTGGDIMDEAALTGAAAGIITGALQIPSVVREANWWRMLTNKERGLVVQTLDDVAAGLKYNPAPGKPTGYSDGEVEAKLARLDSGKFQEMLQKRMQTEGAQPDVTANGEVVSPVPSEAVVQKPVVSETPIEPVVPEVTQSVTEPIITEAPTPVEPIIAQAEASIEAPVESANIAAIRARLASMRAAKPDSLNIDPILEAPNDVDSIIQAANDSVNEIGVTPVLPVENRPPITITDAQGNLVAAPVDNRQPESIDELIADTGQGSVRTVPESRIDQAPGVLPPVEQVNRPEEVVAPLPPPVALPSEQVLTEQLNTDMQQAPLTLLPVSAPEGNIQGAQDVAKPVPPPDLSSINMQYRIKENSDNSASIFPQVGKTFSAGDHQTIKDYAKAQGHYIKQTGNGWQIVPKDGSEGQPVIIPPPTPSETMKKADAVRADKKAVVEGNIQQRIAGYNDSPAKQWVESNFPEVNNYNKQSMARYLDGTDKKPYLGMSNQHVNGLNKLGISIDGNKTIPENLKESYAKDPANVPNPQAAIPGGAPGVVAVHPKDAIYEKLMTKAVPAGENLYSLTDKQVNAIMRNKVNLNGRPEETASFYLKHKSDVTGIPQDQGWILKDKRPDNASRVDLNSTPATSAPSPMAEKALALGKGDEPVTVRPAEPPKAFTLPEPHKVAFDKLLKEELGNETYDPTSPVGRNAWQKAFTRLKEEYPSVTNAFDLDKPLAEVRAKSIASGNYTFATHADLFKALRNGEPVDTQTVKDAFKSVQDNKEAIKAELSKLTKAELLKQVDSYRYSNENKPSIVNAAYDAMVNKFAYIDGSDSIMYDMGGRNTAIQKRVDALTPEHLKTYAEKAAEQKSEMMKRYEGYAKSLKNPETWDEFKNFIEMNKGKGGIDALTPEQKVRYDELHAEHNKEIIAKELDRKAVVRAAAGPVEAEVIETKHTKTGIPLFVVKAAERVDKDVYQAWNNTAKRLGGGYSSYARDGAVPGFQFKNKDSAEAFRDYLKGETEAATETVKERIETKQETRKENAASRLTDLADSMEEKANTELNRDRLTNTAKRAGQAESSDASARRQIAMAKTIRNIAEAIDEGVAKHLEGVSAATHVETLDGLLRSAKSNYERTHNIDYMDSKKRSVTAEDIDDAHYPYPNPHKDHLRDIVKVLLKTKGGMRDGQWLSKVISTFNNPDSSNVRFNGPDSIGRLTEAISKVKDNPEAKHAVANTLERMQDYKRLQKMKIPDLPTLRAALREHLQFKDEGPKADKAKQLERALAGNKSVGVDFFPTPLEVAADMVERAGIEPGMKVLEPSGGTGNIATAMKEAGGNVDVAEISQSLRDVLEAKGHNLVERDFMDLTEGGYDRVVMNPPFSADIEHVQHAFKLLKPGGKLVAIVGEGSFGNQRKHEDFKQWLDDNGASVEKLPQGTFSDRTQLKTTGANARLVEITKPTVNESSTVPEDPSREHLNALELNLSHERERLASAKTDTEREQRKVWVDQIQKEVSIEKEKLDIGADNYSISDEELLRELTPSNEVEKPEGPRDYTIAAQRPGFSKDDLKSVADVVQAFNDGKITYGSDARDQRAYASHDAPKILDDRLAAIPDDAKISVAKDKVTLTVKGEPLTGTQIAENKLAAKKLTNNAEQLRKKAKELDAREYTKEEKERLTENFSKTASKDRKSMAERIAEHKKYHVFELEREADQKSVEASDLLTAKSKDIKHVFYFEGDRRQQGQDAGGELVGVRGTRTGNKDTVEIRDKMKQMAGALPGFKDDPTFVADGEGWVHYIGKNESGKPVKINLAEGLFTGATGKELRPGDTVRLSPGYLENKTDEVYLIPKGGEGTTFYSSQPKQDAGNSGLDGDTITDNPTDVTEDDIKLLEENGYTPVGVQGETSDMLREIGKRFNTSLVFFKVATHKGIDGRGGTTYSSNGFVSYADGRTVFVNADSSSYLGFVLGHEIGHEFGINSPEQYEKLLNDLAPYMNIPNMMDYIAKLKDNPVYSDMDTVAGYKEAVSDAIGELFVDKKFWNTVAVENPSLFKKLADAVLKVLNKIKDVFVGSTRTNKLFNEYEKVQRILAEAMKKYAAKGGEGDVFYSRGKPSKFKQPIKVESTPEQRASVDELNNQLAKDNGEEWRNAYEPSRLSDTGITEAFRRTFGVDINPIQPTAATFDGIGAMYHQGKIYVNTTGTTAGFVQLAGHELLHDIKNTQPGIYNHFAKKARVFIIREDLYRARLESVLMPHEARPTAEQVTEEILADFTGDALADPEFLKFMAEASPTKFKMFLRAVLDWFKKILYRMKAKGFGSSTYVKDVTALRDELAGVLDAYSEINSPSSIDGVMKYSRVGRELINARAERFRKGASSKMGDGVDGNIPERINNYRGNGGNPTGDVPTGIHRDLGGEVSRNTNDSGLTNYQLDERGLVGKDTTNEIRNEDELQGIRSGSTGIRRGASGADITPDRETVGMPSVSATYNTYLDKAEEAINKGDEKEAVKWLDKAAALDAETEKTASQGTPSNEPFVTGIKNAITEEEQGPQDKWKFSREGIIEEGKNKADNDPAFNPRQLAKDIIKDPHMVITPEAQAGLLYDRTKLHNEHRSMTDQLADAVDGKDKAKITELVQQRARIEDDLANNAQAVTYIGTSWSAFGHVRQAIMAEDYSLSWTLQRVRAATGQKDIPDDIRAKLEDLTKRLEEAEKKSEEYEQKLKDYEASKKVKTVIERVRLTERPDKRESNRKVVDAEFTMLSKKLHGLFGRINIGLDPEAVYTLGLMAKNRVIAGIKNANDIIDDIHLELSDIPELDKRTIRDAISSYGKTQQMTQDEISVDLREARRQMRLISALEDAEGGDSPLKTGLQRDPVSDEVRELQRMIRDAMRENGVDSQISPEDQWKTSIDAVKTRLKNEIRDLDKQIAGGKRTIKDRKILDYDEEAKQLKIIRDEKKQLLESIDAKPPKSEEEMQKIALRSYKTRTASRIIELERKLAEGDFEKKAKRVLNMDPDAQKLKDESAKLKDKVDTEIRRIQLANRGKWEKSLDYFGKWQRFVILSGTPTIAKLTAAATTRIVVTPMEEAVGSLLHLLPYIKGISGMAPREGGGLNVKAESAAFTELFMKHTWEDTWDVAKTGRGELDRLYGKHHSGENSWLDLPGRIHGALKNPVKRAEFARSLQKITEWYMGHGYDVSNPETVTIITGLALAEGKRAIFMQDSPIVSGHQGAMNIMKAKGHFLLPALVKFLLPIIKIPTNFIDESLSYTPAGAVRAGVRIGKMGGKSKLTADDADYVMRNLKKSVLGTVLLFLGAMLFKESLGGFYKQGEKREKGAPKAGEIKTPIGVVPKVLLHSPAYETMMIGASMAKTIDEYRAWNRDPKHSENKKEHEYLAAIGEAGAGVLEATPFISAPGRFYEAMKNPASMGKFGSSLIVRSLLIPPDVGRLAKMGDKAGNEVIPRKEDTFGRILQGSTPGLRTDVPVDVNRFKRMPYDRAKELYENAPSRVRSKLYEAWDKKQSAHDRLK